MWDFLSEKSKKFVETLESGSLSLEQDSTSKDRDLFSSFLDQRPEPICGFIEEETGIYSIGFDVQPTERESHGGLPEGVIGKIKEIYKEEPNIELEKFANFFFERVKNDPEPTGDYYESNPDEDYGSSSIIDYLYSEFDHFYVSISGSRSDRWNSLSLRPKWHYEYLLCALKYCVESGKAQKELKELLDTKASSSHIYFLTGRGPPIVFEDKESEKKELSPKEKLMAELTVKHDSPATAMAKEIGINDKENITYGNMIQVYIAVLKNMLDYKPMNLWPAGMMSGAPPASKCNNMFDLYRASCKYFCS